MRPVRGIVAYELEQRTAVADDSGSWLWSLPLERGVEQESNAVRKVHHPKIVQRADRRWVVVCEDCERDREAAMPIGINTPVTSREKAELLWENHCERRRRPVRRGT